MHLAIFQHQLHILTSHFEFNNTPLLSGYWYVRCIECLTSMEIQNDAKDRESEKSIVQTKIPGQNGCEVAD